MKKNYEPEKVDVFSLGVLIYILRTVIFPFENANIVEDTSFRTLNY
jgi:hypothetical protein